MYSLEIDTGDKKVNFAFLNKLDDVSENITRWFKYSRGGEIFYNEKKVALPSKDDFEEADKIIITIIKDEKEKSI